MAEAFRVLNYSIDILVQCLAESSLASKEAVEGKLHRRYFAEYFAALEAKTIVVELDYFDRDFLEDYAAYYVRCFEQYSRTTTRLHFFDAEFTEDQFRETLSVPDAVLNSQKLQGSYLGFIVVKPLPQTIVGRTCLKTYPSDNGRREFPILRSYSANLFGVSLKIDSLAYQEQDTVVAACATSALWSCFQGTGKLFQHAIPSPVEITKTATNYVPENLLTNSARSLPNSGLTATQMALAIRAVGLEPYVVGTPDPYVLNSTLYAYLRCRIPAILALHLTDVVNGKDNPMGGHAVAVTGFSLGADAPQSFGQSGFLLRAARMDKIYAHDDQVGPFARMEYAYSNRPYLATSWQGSGTVEALPWFLLLPLYHKIRIPYSVVHDTILLIDSLIDQVRVQLYPNLPRPEWDIYLTTVSDFKEDVFISMRSNRTAFIEQTLTAQLPRFLWRATAWCGPDQHLDLLFDATGIVQHRLIVHAIASRAELPTLLGALAQFVSGNLGNLQAEAVLNWFSPTP